MNRSFSGDNRVPSGAKDTLNPAGVRVTYPDAIRYVTVGLGTPTVTASRLRNIRPPNVRMRISRARAYSGVIGDGITKMDLVYENCQAYKAALFSAQVRLYEIET